MKKATSTRVQKIIQVALKEEEKSFPQQQITNGRQDKTELKRDVKRNIKMRNKKSAYGSVDVSLLIIMMMLFQAH